MNKGLPKIFKKNVDTSHCHNKKVYYTSEDKIEPIVKVTQRNSHSSLTTVEEKIRKLFKSSRYVFNINVLIKTDKKDYDTKIAGKVKNTPDKCIMVKNLFPIGMNFSNVWGL